jgi:pilus assembly protein CpaE
MRIARTSGPDNKTVVAVQTADPAFEQSVRSTFGVSGAIELRVISGTALSAPEFETEGVTVFIIDLDANRGDEVQALERLMLRIGTTPPVVVVTQGSVADVARSLLQMRVADFLVKPVQPVELVRTCARVARASGAETTEAQIYTFLPAVGGAGVTTLAIQTALLLPDHLSGRPRLSARCLRRLPRS